MIVYSASACWGPDYKLGLLTLTGTDPLNPAHWTKKSTPVFQRNDANGVFAPGHNGFFKSPDGTEDWIVYHANDSASRRLRHEPLHPRAEVHLERRRHAQLRHPGTARHPAHRTLRRADWLTCAYCAVDHSRKYLTSQILCSGWYARTTADQVEQRLATPSLGDRVVLDFTVLDLDFPVGSKNKTATLVTGSTEALLVDAGFTLADGHRLVAAVLDSGKMLTTVFISHGDPDFYFGAEVLADAFPAARFVATPETIKHINHSYEGKLKAWAALGPNLPTRLVDIEPLDDLVLEGQRFELKGSPDRGYLWQAESRTVLGGVLLFQQEHVWVADSATPELRASLITLLDEMAALDPQLVVPGHRLPGTPTDATAIAATREYLVTFEEELANASDGAALTAALIKRYPDNGMQIAATIGAKVAKGEMSWG